jgi:hypothetical protein
MLPPALPLYEMLLSDAPRFPTAHVSSKPFGIGTGGWRLLVARCQTVNYHPKDRKLSMARGAYKVTGFMPALDGQQPE